MKIRNAMATGIQTILLISVLASSLGGCASIRSVLALDYNDRPPVNPIKDPFAEYRANTRGDSNMIVRSKKGDRSVEVQFARSISDSTDFSIPMGSSFKDAPTSPRVPTAAGQANDPLAEAITEAPTVEPDTIYESAMRRVRTFFRAGRFEAALVETENTIRQYPGDARLYRMRGTLLDRVGRTDLALSAWNQALKLDPGNAGLRKYIERRQQGRSLASP